MPPADIAPSRYVGPHSRSGGPDAGQRRVRTAQRAALVVALCLLFAACASAPPPRPPATGFGAEAGVADPYAEGKRHLEDGEHELAVRRFGEALARDRRSLDALNGLGIAYTRLAHFDAAHRQFERALQIDPTSALTLNNYGWSLLEQGRLREARAFFEQARRYATEHEDAVIAANLEILAHVRPPALVAALNDESGPGTPPAVRRLLRVDERAWRLQTAAAPLLARPGADRAPPEQAAAVISDQRAASPEAQSASSGASQDAASVAQSFPPAAPRPQLATRAFGPGPIRLWPRPATGADADTTEATLVREGNEE